MTLVYAKSMGMFVCGTDPGGRGGWGLGGAWGLGGEGVPGNLGPTHRWLSVGGGGVYIRTYVTYVRFW